MTGRSLGLSTRTSSPKWCGHGPSLVSLPVWIRSPMRAWTSPPSPFGEVLDSIDRLDPGGRF